MRANFFTTNDWRKVHHADKPRWGVDPGTVGGVARRSPCKHGPLRARRQICLHGKFPFIFNPLSKRARRARRIKNQ
jgi:hypothetical protein